MTALQCFGVFNRPQTQQLQGTGWRGAEPWSDLIQIPHADVGDPGDEVVWICHADIGEHDWIGPNLPASPVAEVGVDVFATDLSAGFYESTTWLDSLPRNGAGVLGGNGSRNGFSAAFMVRSTLDGTSFRFGARVGLGPTPAQRVGISSVLITAENVSVIAVNLTRLTSRGVWWQWTDSYAFPLPSTLRPFSTISASANAFSSTSDPLLSPISTPTLPTDATYLVLGGSIVAPGSSTDRFSVMLDHLDPFGASGGGGPGRQRSGPAGHRARAPQPDNSSSFPHLQNIVQGLMVTVPADDPAHEFNVNGADAYVAQGPGVSRQSTAAAGLLVVDMTGFQPEFEWRPGDFAGTTFEGPTEWPLYGPAPGEPDADEVENRADLEVTTFVATRKAVICWATPRLQTPLVRWLGFRHTISINDEAELVENLPTDPLYIVSQTEQDALPVYATGELETGRGALTLIARGEFNPDQSDPSRIPAPARYSMPTNGGLFASWNLFEGVQTTAEPPTVAPGPEVYVSIDPEAPDPSGLPRFPYPPDSQIELDERDDRGELSTLDGRTLTWGRFLRPRRVLSLRWTLPRGMHELFVRWLEALDAPLVQFALDGEQPRAYAIQTQSRTSTEDVQERIHTTSLSMVELVWTDSGGGGEE